MPLYGGATLGANTFTGVQTHGARIVTMSALSAIQFGGTTNSFPAIGRSGQITTSVLADESDYCAHSGLYFWVGPNKTVTAGGSTANSLVRFLQAGALGTDALGIYVGSGAPTISAAQGSLYLRTDGTTTNDRAYINRSSGSGTTWTALTTAA